MSIPQDRVGSFPYYRVADNHDCYVSWSSKDISSVHVNLTGQNDKPPIKISDLDHFMTRTDAITDIAQRYHRRGGFPHIAELHALRSFEEARIRYLAKLREKACELTQQVLNLCRTLIDIKQEHEIEESRIFISRSIRAPIRSLPLEILCRIFRMCIPDDDFRRPTRYAAPLLLGQICKHWREVVWSEPTLWTRPRVWFYDGTSSVGSRLLHDTLDLYRARSRDADFALSVNQTLGLELQGVYRKGDMTDISKILPRCKELWLSFDNSLWLESFNGLDRAVFTQLRSIYLKFHTRPIGKCPLGFLSLAQRLRSVRLHLAWPEIISVLSFPSSELTEMSCTMGVSESIGAASRVISYWRLFMAKYPNLKTIHAYFMGAGWCSKDRLVMRDSYRRFPAISYNFARSLVLRVGFQGDIATILVDFSFPNLENMEIIATSKPVTLIDPFTSFSEGLTTRLSFVRGLTSLRLLRVAISSSELRALLYSAPLLISLDVLKGEFKQSLFEIDDEDLVEDLTIDSLAEKDGPILPCLRDLWLYLSETESVNRVENVARYAALARSRYTWACTHIDTRDADMPSSKVPSCGFPSYPFRLHLKHRDGCDVRTISHAIGVTAFPVLWPEPSAPFFKEC